MLPTPTHRDQAPCPCDSGELYGQCCGPLHRGQTHAATAEQLMRSRYTASCFQLTSYLNQTQIPSLQGMALNPSKVAAGPSKGVAWQHLRIVSQQRGGLDDSQGQVEFIAIYQSGEGLRRLHETSDFERRGGRWFYTTGQVDDRPLPTPGRNAPCWCGSEKKYKRCHGSPKGTQN